MARQFIAVIEACLILLTVFPARAADAATYERFAKVELSFSDATAYKNPYDPTQADLTVTFTAPDGKPIDVPGFWMQPYRQTCSENCTAEQLQADGNPGWRVRFTPTISGNWRYSATLRDVSGARELGQGQFSVVDSKRLGFIRVAANNHYFTYENGTAYFPVGSNLGWSWSGGGGTLTYQRWLSDLHRLGANYGRLYVDVPWFIGLEWKPPAGDYSAAQQDAWRLDTILDTAEAQGIALQLVLLWSQALSTYSSPSVSIPAAPGRPETRADFTSNPYSIAYGGPLSGPALFFSNEAARQLFKRRLRYIAARWGYSTSVFAWEVIDQLDRPSAFTPNAPGDWLKDAVAYLRQTDPAQHLITAGVRDNAKAALLDPIPLDFRQARYYQRRPLDTAADQVTGALGVLNPLINNAEHPILLSEFSLNPWFEPASDDPSGVHVRETMWVAALSGSGGSAFSNWWDTYLFPQNLTAIYGPLAAFTQGIPWSSSDLRPVSVILASDSAEGYLPLRVTGFNTTPNAPRDSSDTIYRLTPEGVLPVPATIPAYLYASNSVGLKRPQQYLITPSVDTTFTVNIKRVSERAAAKLTVSVDGKLTAQMTLKPGSPLSALTIPISAGEHTVTLDNLGDDFLQLDSLEVAAYLAPLRAVTLADRKRGIFAGWFQHREYTWENVAKNFEPTPLNFRVQITGMPPGAYQIELWDPFSGNVVGDEMQTITGSEPGTLTITLLPVTKMIAVRAFRMTPATP